MKIVISGTSFKQRVLKYKKKINSFIDRNIEDNDFKIIGNSYEKEEKLNEQSK